MLKDLKVSGSDESYTATVIVNRENQTGKKAKDEKVSAKGGDKQTALANLKMKAVANGQEQQEFDELAAKLSLEDRIDKPTEHNVRPTQEMKVTGYRSEQLEKGLKTPDESTGK
jgi:hypothetical protein